jgi:D-threonine aldolase
MQENWYKITDVDRLDTPALVIYPEKVKQNIHFAKELLDDINRLRPHVKTHKNGHIAQMMLHAGISRFKCATIAEAEMLAIEQSPDVLLAYQPTGPKLQRFITLIKVYPKTTFSCLVDNVRSAEEISKTATKNGMVINVYIDLNVGMNRTGSLPVDDALELYKIGTVLPGLQVIGLHAYDGHVNDQDIDKRTRHCNKCYEAVAKLGKKLRKLGFAPKIIAGGSPTFPIHAKREEIEVSPGTFVYWDRSYQLNQVDEPFVPAALIVARVVSLPTKTTICIDCGHKSVAAENTIDKRIYFLNAPELKMTGHSEEHLIAHAGEGHKYKIGDVLYGLPWHICPTVALYERVITIENGEVTGEWRNTARDRKITI